MSPDLQRSRNAYALWDLNPTLGLSGPISSPKINLSFCSLGRESAVVLAANPPFYKNSLNDDDDDVKWLHVFCNLHFLFDMLR